ncbi:MAG: hypothetical protein M1834_002733 [Cirrosporium novae-zelandiae]|nr:MAG: hypothetical protein M1834_002733 [Cirrosporium novae-zelandiae]
MNMSSFFSDEAERALMGDEEHTRRLFQSQESMTSYDFESDFGDLGQQAFAPELLWAFEKETIPAPSIDMPLQYPTPPTPETLYYMVPNLSIISVPDLSTPMDQSCFQLSPESQSHSPFPSRNASPTPGDLHSYGVLGSDGTWRCAYPGCTSQAIFTRGCDLRKHYKRHSRTLFCRRKDCPQATQGGFSTTKDRARHEAKHDPKVPCLWEGCARVFSRVDNMKDHARRIHEKSSKSYSSSS